MRKIILFIILFLLFIGSFFAFKRYFPVALSGSWIVSASKFDRIAAGSSIYYRKLAEAAATGTPPIALDKDFEKDIRRATLSKLIEDELIYRVLKQNLGSSLNSVVNSRLKDFPAADSFYERLEEAYGVSKNEYLQEVIIPQARREILEGQLFIRGVDMDKWLADLKKKIWVAVLLPDLKWENGEVELR